MKRILAIAVLLAMLVGGNVAAAEAETEGDVKAGITPASRWYFLDIFAEDVWQAMIGFNKRAKGYYLLDRMKEREAETVLMANEKGLRSEEARQAAGLYLDLQNELTDHVKKLRDERLAREAAADLFGQFQEGIAEEMERLESRKKVIRDQIVEARNAGDDAKTAALLAELSAVKKEYEDFMFQHEQWRSAAEMSAERIEDLFTGRDKAELVLQRAEAAKKYYQQAGDTDGIEHLDALIAQARQAMAGDAAEKIDEAIRNVQKQMHAEKIAAKKRADTVLAAAELPEERGEEPLKEPEPAQTAQKPASPPQQKVEQPPKQPAPPPLGDTDTAKIARPVVLKGVTELNATVGDYFEYSFCRPALARKSDLCTAAATDPSGGQPPYHFQLGSGVGFPPPGLKLNLNGVLSGTPSAAGNATFSVCAVDLAGKSACKTVTVKVTKKAEAVPVGGSVTSVECSSKDLHDYVSWDITIRGTASGPVGTYVENVWSSTGSGCTAWGDYCGRDEGEPAETTWVYKFSTGPEGLFPGDKGEISVGGLVLVPRGTKLCPR